MCSSLDLITQSPGETEALGRTLAALIPRGAVVGLYGGLATGKTCLVRGMASCLTQGSGVHSPTFTLVNQYGRDPILYHVDLYRLAGPGELADLGYEELFDSDGVCAVEWAERANGLLPPHRLDIFLKHGGGDRRRIRIRDRGVLPKGWAARLREALPKPG